MIYAAVLGQAMFIVLYHTGIYLKYHMTIAQHVHLATMHCIDVNLMFFHMNVLFVALHYLKICSRHVLKQ